MIVEHLLNKERKSPLVIRIYLNREPVAYENIKQKTNKKSFMFIIIRSKIMKLGIIDL